MICPNCGLENGKRNVCKKCGTFLQNKQTQRVTDPKELRKMKRAKRRAIAKGCGSSFLLMIVAFIVISVILFVILYFVTKNMKWPTEEELAAEMSQFQSVMDAEEEERRKEEEGASVTITEEP